MLVRKLKVKYKIQVKTIRCDNAPQVELRRHDAFLDRLYDQIYLCLIYHCYCHYPMSQLSVRNVVHLVPFHGPSDAVTNKIQSGAKTKIISAEDSRLNIL